MAWPVVFVYSAEGRRKIGQEDTTLDEIVPSMLPNMFQELVKQLIGN